jgi:hypothetical protein
MKPQTLHAHEDRLLDFAYGELPPQEAQAVQSHLEGCTRCSELLAGIGGVRTVMAQLPMEPAPDAGLESLLAYAQQAARNAAAGPAPKPTWWRRWLVPVMGVATVCAFGVVSVTVNKNLALKEEIEAQSAQAKNAEAAASASPAPSPDDSYRESPKTPAPVALPPSAMQKAAPQAQMVPPTTVGEATSALGAGVAQDQERDVVQGITPPPPAPAAKLDTDSLANSAPRKKPFVAGTKGSRSEWSNAGAGLGFAEDKAASKDAEDERLAYEEAPSEPKSKKSRTYDRRDAMTQSGAFEKQKPILVAPPQGASTAGAVQQQPSTPAQAQAPMAEESPAEAGSVAESTAQVQEDEPSRLSLRVKEGRSRGPAPSKSAEAAPSDDFDELFGGKTSTAKREQTVPSSASRPSAPPPPPPTAAATPMPSVSTANRGAPSKVARAETRDSSSEPSAAELSKLAIDAQRSGNRVLEAQLLRQALAAGVAGKERLGLLNRLCDAEFSLGRRQEAFEACALVLEEGPNSGAAQVARNRLRKEGLETDEAKPGTGSRGPVKAAPAEKKSASDSVLGQ